MRLCRAAAPLPPACPGDYLHSREISAMKKETFTEKRKRANKINSILAQTYPQAKTALKHKSPLQLLVATILSAQCTDERVNEVTKTLFVKYKKAADYANVDPEKLESDIRPTGFFRNKAKSIRACCRELAEKHGGRVPPMIEELVKFPGIGRKTANVVLGSAFGIASGVVVDTHVARLSGRLKLSAEKNPEKIEVDLMKLLPQSEWIGFPHRLISHGRSVCRARKPRCADCSVGKLCPSFAP